jgi:coproporphyrinogen III oxidase
MISLSFKRSTIKHTYSIMTTTICDFSLVSTRMLALRNTIIQSFESFETHSRFERKDWNYKHTGGGQIALIRGDIFEKAAVNFSCISGPHFPMQDGSGPFSACGVSLITHMKNPFVPTVHFNVRMIETSKGYWIGGGYDLTPMAAIEDSDVRHFHDQARICLDQFDASLYPQFKKNADEYFYIPHRQKTRGVGGIFFDHFSFQDFEKDLFFLEKVGSSFLYAILPIIKKYKDYPYNEENKSLQNILRGHYVEFNLIYDRGTKFGFLSGGNPEAILCSMPPLASW